MRRTSSGPFGRNKSWLAMARVTVLVALAALVGVIHVVGGKPGGVDRAVSGLHPLLTVGLDKVAIHLRSAAQLADALTETLPAVKEGVRTEGNDTEVASLLRLAHSMCQPWCVGVAAVTGGSDSGPHWAGDWPSHRKERTGRQLRKSGSREAHWHLVERGVLTVHSAGSGGAVAVTVDVGALEVGLAELDWRGAAFVVADDRGSNVAATRAGPIVRSPGAVDAAVRSCVDQGSATPRIIRLAGSDHVVASEARTLDGLHLHGVLIMPLELALAGGLSGVSVWGVVLRVLAVLAAAGVTVWVLWRVSRGGMEDALKSEMQGHLDDKKRAEAANSAKSMFLANMSHELRTPMAAILLGLDLVLESGTLQSEQEASLLQVKHCASELLTLLNDILDLGKIESGKFHLEAVDFDLAHEIQSVVDMFGIQCAGKGIIIGLEVADEMERIVNGDPLRFRQILGNLISNSIKFTPPGGSIYVSARQSAPPDTTGDASLHVGRGFAFWMRRLSRWLPSKWRRDEAAAAPPLPEGALSFEIEVNDTGCGIPPNKYEAVFETFTQADSTTTRVYGGTGLGLGITRKLVTMMGGSIGFQPKDGPGALVRVRLILAPPDDPFTESPSHALLHAPVPPMLENARIILAMPPLLSRRLAEKWLRERNFDLHICGSVDELMAGLSAGTLVPGFQLHPPPEPDHSGTPISPLFDRSPSLPSTAASPCEATPHLSVPPVVIIDFAMVQAAVWGTDPVLPAPTSPPGAPPRMVITPDLPTVFDADSPEEEPEVELGPPEVIAAMARLKAEMGANIVWLLDPNTPPTVRSGLVKSRGFALLVLRPLHAGRLSEILRKVGKVRERKAQLLQARENLAGRPGSGPLVSRPGSSNLAAALAEAGSPSPARSPAERPKAVLTRSRSLDTPPTLAIHDAAGLETNTTPPGEGATETEAVGRPTARGGRPATVGVLAGLCIMVVEDSVVLQKLVTSMLARMGAARVVQASNGRQAVNSAEQLRGTLHCILMDCQMPVLDGYSATAAIRKLEQGHGTRVPIIALTAHAMLSDEKKCLEAGMDAYLSKPVSPSKLCETVLRLVNRN